MAMDFTNLVFAGILLSLFTAGTLIFVHDLQGNYTQLEEVNPFLANTSEAQSDLSDVVFSAQEQAQQTSGSDDPVGLLMGFFRGAFDAARTLISAPTIFLSMVNVLIASLGGAGALVFLQWALYLAIGAITVVGLLYILAKVK